MVQLRRHVHRHGSELDFLKSIKQDLEVENGENNREVIEKLTGRINSLEHGLSSSSVTPKVDRGDGPSSTSSSVLSGHHVDLQPIPTSGIDTDDISLVTAIEHLAWGRSYGNCFPHHDCACQNRRIGSEATSSDMQAFLFTESDLQDAVNLPNSMDAERLVSFHLKYIAWHHNCVHQPTFWGQCQDYWKTGNVHHPQWMALYCSVLSTAIFCLINSPKFDVRLHGYTGTPDARDLFASMVNVLYYSHFLQNISIYSIQAIMISTEVAHNLGLSQLNATLISAAVRIAESLGLHKIEDTTSSSSFNGNISSENIEKEVGKRVWCQMVIQDHFAIPFTDTYCIDPAQYSTTLPKNADDHDLVDLPDSTPTISSYTRTLVTIAQLMPELAAGLGPLRHRKPVDEQYKHVLRMDQKMRQLVHGIPSFLLRQDQEQEDRLPWLEVARQSLAITSAEKASLRWVLTIPLFS